MSATHEGQQADLDVVAHKARIRATYNAAAGLFDAPALGFWERFGRRTVAGAGIGPGQRVLDVCCGSGSSALAAAESVGPSGAVLGVDFAEDLLALARAKAAARGLGHAQFQPGDMTALPYPDGSFDAVVCQFGVFFVPDMAAAVAGMWRLVRPGGTLAVTTWGSHVLEPGTSILWDVVRPRRPDLVKQPPWQRITTEDALRGLLAEGGVPGDCVAVDLEPDRQPLAEPADFWTVVLGTGYRAVVDALSAPEAEDLRATCVAAVGARGVTELASEALYSVARRPI